MLVCRAGRTHDAQSSGEPTGSPAPASARTSFASRIAPSRFNSPAPCSNWLKPASGCDVYIKIILMRLGVRDGLACRSEEHTSELQSRQYLVCRLLLEKKNRQIRVSVSMGALHTCFKLVYPL